MNLRDGIHLSLALEELDLPLMLFGSVTCFERAEVFAFACFGIFLFRIETVFA